jgi:hypothetical protein
MRRPTFIALLIALIATVSLTACGPEETTEQRLERLRYNHVIYPVGTTTLYDDEGNPTLLVDLDIANQGTEPLTNLTVLLRVKSGLGKERLVQRVTVPLDDLRPGVGRQQDVRIAGFALEEEDEITVEIEKNLTPEDLRTLPEYADVSGGGG